MTETTASSDTARQQKSGATFFAAVFNTNADPLLKAQADVLESVETTLTGWLRRRQEGVTETQALVARLRASNDPAAFLSAQQEWVTGAVRRLTADATAYQSAAAQLAERARGWFPLAGEIFADGATPAPEAAPEAANETAADAGRASGRQLRMANKAAE